MSPSAISQRLMAMAVCLLITLPAVADIHPLAEDQQTSREVAQAIRYGHYEDVTFDAQWAKRAYQRWLDIVDPQHLYLLASDVQEFSSLESRYPAAIESGQLDFAFTFYNRFQQRMEHRLETLIGWLTSNPKFDYTPQERMSLENDKAPWASKPEVLDEMWRKRLKNAALTIHLTEPKLDDKQIAERLIKRYKEQLNRLRQTNHEDVLNVFLTAGTSAIDPHTEYMSPSRSESFDIQMKLSLDGIGALLQAEDEYVKVSSLVPGGPAEKGGQLHPADKIIAVGNDDGGEMTSVVGMRLDDVVNRIRGPKGSVVRLQIIPARAMDTTQTRIVTIRRDKVNLEDQAAHSKVIDVTRDGKTQKIGIITVPAFYVDFNAWQAGEKDYRSTTRDVRALLEELKRKRVQGVVLDLRNNGGGALQEANSMVGLFIDRGPTVQVRDARGRVSLYGDDERGMVYEGPLAVLVDRMSASASEIFAGAIQDYGRGLIIGGQTFGKGTVQTITDMTRGELRMTRAKFYRISGESTQERGVTPDIMFPNLLDNHDIGESALPNALPWDVVRPVHYRRQGMPSRYLDELRRLHDARVPNNPNFLYLQREAALLKQLREQNTSVSLNLMQRRQEMDSQKAEQLALENDRRRALGMPELEKLDDENDTLPGMDDRHDTPIDQAQLHEAAEIILDYARLLSTPAQ